MIKRIIKKIRERWHNDLTNSQEVLFKQEIDLLEQKRRELNIELAHFCAGLIRTTPRRTIRFCFDIIERCNLNCIGCLTYAPLATKLHSRHNGGGGYIMKTDSFRNDVKQLSKLFNEDEIQVISISGGEALLHPEVTTFFEIAREYFPNVDIRLGTNGLLLTKQREPFWESCRKNNIVLEQTKYPIQMDFEQIKNEAKKNGVKHIYIGDTGENTKTMQVFPVDIRTMNENVLNDQNERMNFFNCWEANTCIRVKDGKVYTCSRIPHAHLFNEYFGTNLKITEDDYIDIYKAQNKFQIYDFLAHAVPFCRYCKVNGIRSGYEWKVSDCEIHEWADD